MDANRPYKCSKCSKAFKLKQHLKKHDSICSGKSQCFQCDQCGKKMTSKRTLKVHVETTCNPSKKYQCPLCDDVFSDYTDKHKHYIKKHSKIECDFCDFVCDEKHIKRHMHLKHKNLRPSSAHLVPSSKLDSNFKCDDCEKCFYDKSTLNRHRKLHIVRCKYCDKWFQSKTKVLEHQISHVKQKNVNWKEDIVEVKEIPLTKVSLDNQTVNTLVDLKKTIDDLLLIFTNRGQSVTLELLKEAIERTTNKDLSENIFRAVLSVSPEDYSLSMSHGNVYVKMENSEKRVTPTTNEKRRTHFKNQLHKMKHDNAKYIDLIMFPETAKHMYKSAKQVLEENIVAFSSDEYDVDENINSEETSPFSKIKEKIRKKSYKKQRRQHKFNKVDWQKKRLPQLARAVNSVFISESKSTLNIYQLLEKTNYESVDKKGDLERLIQESNEWLKVQKGWVRRKSSRDINDICMLFV